MASDLKTLNLIDYNLFIFFLLVGWTYAELGCYERPRAQFWAQFIGFTDTVCQNS